MTFPFLTVDLKRAAIARHGLSVRELGEAIETAFVGLEVSRVLEGDASFDLVVRYDPEATADLDRIRTALVTTATGARHDRRAGTVSALWTDCGAVGVAGAVGHRSLPREPGRWCECVASALIRSSAAVFRGACCGWPEEEPP